MLNDPGKNVALTFEQQEQIATAEGRLRNIEAETTIANKNLSVLQKEVIKATKEREYQGELIAGLQSKVSDKEVEFISVSSSVAMANETLANAQKEIAEIQAEASRTTESLNGREAAVLAAENALSEARAALYEDRAALESERAAVEAAADAFKEAALTVTWKSSKA